VSAQNNETRRAMLAAIRTHLRASAPHDAARAAHQARLAEQHAPESGQAAAPTPDLIAPVERFRRALEAVAGRCVVVRDEAAAAEALRQIVEQRGARRVALSDAPLVGRVARLAPLPAEVLEDATTADLFDCDLGVTGAQWGVAETGTLVLESDRERHRLASLVPAAHVALVEARHVRQTLGEVLAALGAGELSRTVTFITGPSRTSDIELTLAVGVHGPAELYVIIIEAAGDNNEGESDG
jgi:L-lactate dehydrogenase complex protein LldG